MVQILLYQVILISLLVFVIVLLSRLFPVSSKSKQKSKVKKA